MCYRERGIIWERFQALDETLQACQEAMLLQLAVGVSASAAAQQILLARGYISYLVLLRCRSDQSQAMQAGLSAVSPEEEGGVTCLDRDLALSSTVLAPYTEHALHHPTRLTCTHDRSD